MSFSLVMFLQVAQIVHQLTFLLGSKHHIHPFDGRHLLGFQLRITTSYHHESTRMVLHQAMDSLTTFLVGHLGHGTSIDDTNVRFLALAHRTHSRFLQHLSDGGSFREIQFATQGIKSSLLILKYCSIYHISIGLKHKVSTIHK